MSTTVISRPPRRPGPDLPEGRIELQEPPALPEQTGFDLGSMMMYLPMGLMAGAMMLMYAGPGGSVLTYMGSGMMGLAMVGMMLGQLGRQASERKQKMRGERRDYMRYLTQTRAQVRTAMEQQRVAVSWDRPDPGLLWTVAIGPRLWERRGGHPDFAEVRVAVGGQRSRLELVPPQTKPIEDLEPACSGALRRFIRAHSVVPEVPAAFDLRVMPSASVAGPRDHARALARAMLAQAVTFHAPEELRVAIVAGGDQQVHWEWAKWLPHLGHPAALDAAGPVRLFSTQPDELLSLLGSAFNGRSGFEPGATPGVVEPFLLVICDGTRLSAEFRMLASGMRNTSLVDLGEDVDDDDPRLDQPHAVHLVVDELNLRSVTAERSTSLGVPDGLSIGRCETLARLMAPMRTGGAVDSAEPLSSDFDMTRLLGVRDIRQFDVRALWRLRSRTGKLRVPIGVGEDGSVVELDIKESAQGGMGPHGMLIGATGSGKSELLRTLVITLATTHSSEHLNFVLVDFKGGATFLGCEELPHTSAVITNLADELPLVDRMQAALHGELIRRQEVLRAAGFSSLQEYEKARQKGTLLAPMPTLFVVVDEFSELLANKPEFMDLFVMIGRLGRSLGVHLLLASQRLDEGRIHALESHLSYRIALRTFSAMESRSIIGVTKAHELPPQPGNGYLKFDTNTLVRFKAGYVSGPAPEPPAPGVLVEPHGDVTRFDLNYQVPHSPAALLPPEPVADTDQENADSVMSVLIDRLRGAGPPAREVWLPPLADPPTLDHLLPGVAPDPERGLTSAEWRGSGALRVPLGVVDRPFEQQRELLIADLGGAAGHAAVVGAPQSGKSTLVRTLVMSLALTHTPAEAQFYCLDFGGGSLTVLSGLPHVGSIATRLDKDRVRRTVAELLSLLERRERAFAAHGLESMTAYRRLRRSGAVEDPYGDVFLVVDGWFTLRNDFEDVEQLVAQLVARGLGYGIHVLAAAARWSEIRPSVRDAFGTRYELRLGDPLESELGSRLAAKVPDQPGRGLLKGGMHFLAALPRLDGASRTDDLPEATKALVEEVAEYWPQTAAPGVRLLPAALPADSLPAPTGDVQVAIGVDERRLKPVVHDFARQPHLLVFGDSETGKTNILRLVADAVVRRYSPSEVKFIVGDARRDIFDAVPRDYQLGYAVSTDALTECVRKASVSMRKRVPGPQVTPERMRARDWWSGPELYVVIDDYELMSQGLQSGPMGELLPLLAHGADIGLHVIIARSTSGAMRAVMDPAIRQLWDLGTPGVLFSCPKEEGKFLGEAPPRQLPAGRAQLVTRKGVQLIQTALAAAPGGGDLDDVRG